MRAAMSGKQAKNYFAIHAIFLIFFLLLSAPCSSLAASYPNTAMVIAGFGSSYAEENPAEQVKATMQKLHPELRIYTAYTAHRVAAARKSKGETPLVLSEALAKAGAEGYKKVALLSLHVVPGAEYADVQKTAQLFTGMPKGIEQSTVGAPLLSSYTDIETVADALLRSLPPERKKTDAVVFVGHGTHENFGSITYHLLHERLQKRDANIFITTLEGDMTLPDTLKELRAKGIKKAFIAPLLLVVGAHAQNDLFGPEGWVNKLKAQGIEAVPVPTGLAALPEVMNIFTAHAQEALNNLK